ncbi:MAG TPA: hypothetical protein VGI27_03135 [Solirubrobacteraceae bacterium]|jgi:hypothetical protein
MSDGLLAIYLNDHLAGAVAGAALAGRLAGSNRDREEFGPALQELAAQVREDRDTLSALMRRLGVGIDRAKLVGAWAAEKVGRLKLNGRLRGYSPLSRVEELEVMRLGVTGKRTLWKALYVLAEQDLQISAAQLELLIERAERQLDVIEACHTRAVAEAFAPAGGSTVATP